MCLQPDIRSTLECLSTHFGDGQTRAELIPLEHQGGIDCTSYHQMKQVRSQMNHQQETLSSTFEYLLENRKTILNDKEFTCSSNVLDAQSSKTLDLGSTGNGQVCSPFWTEHSKEISRKLWSLAGTGCRDWDSKSLNGCSIDMVAKSQCYNQPTNHQKKSCQTISCPLSRSFAAGETGSVDTKQKEVIKTRKVKLNPTRDQKESLRMFASHARYTYNEAVRRVNDKTHNANRLKLRNSLVTAKNNPWVQERSWLLDTPKVIRQQAVFEAAKNFKSCFTAKQNKTIDKFKVGYKSKKQASRAGWTLGIEKQLKYSNGKLNILPESLGQIRYYGKAKKMPFQEVVQVKLRVRSQGCKVELEIVEKPVHDCFIHRNSRGQHYLVVPVTIQTDIKPSATKVCALDPGVRKFLTGYSPDGEHGFYAGREASKRIMDVLKSIDNVCTQMAQKDITSKQRRYLRKKKMHLYGLYKNIRDEFHWKLANMLTKQYGTILLPHLQTKQLSQGLRAKAAREMLAQSHGLFLQRLKDKCLERAVTLLTPTEHYTSKTCGSCGCLNSQLGSSEVFECRCGYVADRDLNAARNIYIRTLSLRELTPVQPDMC